MKSRETEFANKRSYSFTRRAKKKEEIYDPLQILDYFIYLYLVIQVLEMVISHCAGCFSNGLECSFFLGFIDAQNSDSLKLLCKDLQTLCEAKLLLRVLKRNLSPVLKRNDLTAVSPIVKKYAQSFNSPSLNYRS